MAFCAPSALPTARRRRAPRAHTTSPARRTPRACAGDSLVVVGAGELGSRVARLWRAAHAEASIVCVTQSRARHAALTAAGVTPVFAGEGVGRAEKVVCCVPPRDSTEAAYVATVREAGALARTRFVFTSSTGVLADAAVATERSPTADGERARMLLAAEAAALGAPGAVVLRLAGLYSLEVGAHAYWLERGAVPTGPARVNNMVHLDDAAAAVVAALRADDDRVVGQRFLITDGAPLATVNMFRAALAHPRFSGFGLPEFGEGGPSKVVDGSWSNRRLGWEPRHKGFVQFMREQTALAASAVE